MKKHKFKRYLALLITLLMFMTISSTTVSAQVNTNMEQQSKDVEAKSTEDTPLIGSIVANIGALDWGLFSASILRVSVEDTDVHGASAVKVTATWKDTGNLPLKGTINVTNGAKILAKTESDIVFKSDNYALEKPVTDLYVNDDLDEMTFTTGTNKKDQYSYIEFEVEAPLGNRNFDVTVFMGKEDGSSINNISNTNTIGLNVISGLSVETRDKAKDGIEINYVDDYHPFYLTGMAWYKGGDAPDPSYILINITNKETGEVVGEYEDVVEIENREYNYGPIYMPSKFDDGKYEVTVYMINDDYYNPQVLGSSKTEINFKKMPDIFEVAIYNQFKNIRASQSFIKEADEPPVLYDYLWVRPGTYWVANDGGHGNCNINASVEFKNAKDIVSSKFFVHGSFETTTFNGQKSGNLVFANLTTFRTDAYINENSIYRRPYIDCEVTYKNGTKKLIYIGEIKVALDPSGKVTDAVTGNNIVGATCTLYVRDKESGEWVMWIDETGQQSNPVITGQDGKYGWDVQAGSYDVRIYHPDYYASDNLFYSTLLDPRYGELVVPPERTNIDVQLNKQTGSLETRALMVSLTENYAVDIVPTYTKELDEAIQNNTELIIRVPEEAIAFYMTKDQVQSILNAGIDLVVVQGSQRTTVDRAVLEAYAQAVRNNVCFLMEDL